MKEVGG
jgi:hypothetical protein